MTCNLLFLVLVALLSRAHGTMEGKSFTTAESSSCKCYKVEGFYLCWGQPPEGDMITCIKPMYGTDPEVASSSKESNLTQFLRGVSKRQAAAV